MAQFAGFTDDFLDFIGSEYGGRAKRTMEDWEELVNTSRGIPEMEQLKAVNLFFNKRIWFVDDRDHWGREDYWATPMETMATLGGDCEDFVIAKYFTLREVGVPDERLRLTYVRSTLVSEPHMVLAYYQTPDSEPLVLDNLMDAIRPASRRRDLTPVYSFNGRSLWRAKEFGEGRRVGSAGSVNLWADVIRRMRAEDFPY
jgi:predicted transglutaminase-like cysteine proteinase